MKNVYESWNNHVEEVTESSRKIKWMRNASFALFFAGVGLAIASAPALLTVAAFTAAVYGLSVFGTAQIRSFKASQAQAQTK